MNFSRNTCVSLILKLTQLKVIWSNNFADTKGHIWCKRFAEQQVKESNSSVLRAEMVYEQYKNTTCSRMNTRGDICGGQTVVRSFTRDRENYDERAEHTRIFIGCARWQDKEQHHFIQYIRNYDPITLLKKWGRDRCHVHPSILNDLSFSWEVVNNLGLGISLLVETTYHRLFSDRMLFCLFKFPRTKIRNM